jgi:N6-L-threonylcarbamoyladenine synthase
MLGLGFPGGPALDRLAQTGNARTFGFPKSRIKKDSLEFSFSGLKTALLYTLHSMEERQQVNLKADMAAGYQEAIVTVLIDKAFMALKQTGVRALAVVGGVSANSRLRSLLQERALATHTRISLPPLRFCTDNAAMVAAAGRHALIAGRRMPLGAEPWSTLEPTSESFSL